MPIRISDGLRFQSSLARLQEARKGTRDVLERLGTGQRINRPSDDPAAEEERIGWETVRGDITRYQEQIDRTGQWLDTTDLVLGRVGELVAQAAELAEGNVNSDAVNRRNAIRSVENIENELLALANGRSGERYLFAGSAAAVVPFVEDTDAFGNPVVRYDGNDESLLATIGGNSTLACSVSGTDAFFRAGRSLFQVLSDLKSALDSGDGAAVGQLRLELEGFDDQVIEVRSINGVRQARLQSASAQLKALDQKMAQLVDAVQTVDVAELSAQFTVRQIALDASYELTVRVGEMSVLDFLE